jgi:hypothetical protein
MKTVRLVLVALAFTTAWLGLDIAFPAAVATGIPFALTRIVVDGLILLALWRLGLGVTIGIPLVLWEILAWTLAINGTFARTTALPGPLPFAIAVPIIVALALLMSSKRVAAALDVTPASWLIGIQLYRVIGGTFLVFLARGVMPWFFALPAGIGDVAVGLLALPTALWVSSGTPAGRTAAIRWNILGLIDLTVAITTGFLSTLGPNPNVQLGAFPTALVPAFAVPTSIILHVLSLWQLRRMTRRASRSATIPMAAHA